MLVDARDIKFYEVAEVETPKGRAVRIEGLVMHSSLAVNDIVLRRNEHDVTIEVYITQFRKGLSGSFTTEVLLDSGIKRIIVGPTANEVWPIRSVPIRERPPGRDYKPWKSYPTSKE